MEKLAYNAISLLSSIAEHLGIKLSRFGVLLGLNVIWQCLCFIRLKKLIKLSH